MHSPKEKRTKSPTDLGWAAPMVGPQVQQPPTSVLRLKPASPVEANSQSPIHKVATGHVYIYGQAQNVSIGLSITTKMMVDQGNLLGTGVGMSEAFLKNMKLGYMKIARSNVRMAAKGAEMTRLGLSKPFTIHLDGIRTGFDVQATIIKELADDINLGAGFLQKIAAHGISTQLAFLGAPPCIWTRRQLI